MRAAKKTVDPVRIREIYEEVREEFYFPPTTLNLHKGEEEATFFIRGMEMYLDETKIPNEAFCRGVVRHELGHPQYAPITLSNMFRHAKSAYERYGFNPSDVREFLNIVYDIIVDHSVHTKHRDTKGFGEMARVMKAKEGFKERLRQNPFLQLFFAAHCSYSRDPRLRRVRKQVAKEMTKVTVKSVNICRNQVGLEDCVIKIEELIVAFYKKYAEQKKEQDKTWQQMLIEAAKEASKMRKDAMKEKKEAQTAGEDEKPENAGYVKDASGNKVTEYNLGNLDEKSKKRVMAQLQDIECNPDNEVAREILVSLAKSLGVNLNEIDFYRIKARKSVRFKLKPKSKQGRTVYGGTTVWVPEDGPEKFIPEAGLIECGINIPGVTTRKAIMIPGPALEANKKNKVVIVLDTSISMDRHETISVLFSLISACEIEGLEVGVILFHKIPYLSIASSKKYRQTEREIWDKFETGGTYIAPAVREAAKICDNAFVLVGSDFYSSEEDSLINREYEALARRNTVKNVVLFGGRIPENNVPYVCVRDMRELEGAIIEEVDSMK